jgi:hypothetical protein
MVKDPFALLIGLVATCQALLQFLAATGRVEITFWPFVQTESRALRFVASGVSLFLAVVAFILAFT